MTMLLAKMKWFICDVIPNYHLIGGKWNRTINPRKMTFASRCHTTAPVPDKIFYIVYYLIHGHWFSFKMHKYIFRRLSFLPHAILSIECLQNSSFFIQIVLNGFRYLFCHCYYDCLLVGCTLIKLWQQKVRLLLANMKSLICDVIPYSHLIAEMTE